MENLMKFTIQLAMLSSLFDEKMISEKEFIKIKAELERKYKIKRGLSGT
jgi:hypothetical protein